LFVRTEAETEAEASEGLVKRFSSLIQSRGNEGAEAAQGRGSLN